MHIFLGELMRHMTGNIHHSQDFVFCPKRNTDECLQTLCGYQVKSSSVFFQGNVFRQYRPAALSYFSCDSFTKPETQLLSIFNRQTMVNTVRQRLSRFIQKHNPSNGPIHNVKYIIQANLKNSIQVLQATDCRRDSTQSYKVMIMLLRLISLIRQVYVRHSKKPIRNLGFLQLQESLLRHIFNFASISSLSDKVMRSKHG